MTDFLKNKFTQGVVLSLLFALSMNAAVQLPSAGPAINKYVIISSVAIGPTMPPDPWAGVEVAIGPTMPPDPWAGVALAIGPTMPPDPWAGIA